VRQPVVVLNSGGAPDLELDIRRSARPGKAEGFVTALTKWTPEDNEMKGGFQARQLD
jgi:hypothetical protein